jgi:hypothetical protein
MLVEILFDCRAAKGVTLPSKVPIALRDEPLVKIVEQRPEHRQSSMAMMGLGQKITKHRILLFC